MKTLEASFNPDATEVLSQVQPVIETAVSSNESFNDHETGRETAAVSFEELLGNVSKY